MSSIAAAARMFVPDEGEVLRLRRAGHPGVVVLKTDPANTTGTELDFGVEWLDPGVSIPTHLHEEQEEVLVVTAGEGTLVLGEETHDVGPGCAAYVPAGTWHAVHNPGPGRLDVLWVMRPGGLSQYFREVGAPPEENAAPLPDSEIAAAAERHGMRVR